MDSKTFREFLKSSIIPFAKDASGKTEINCRCFYCADSKDIRKGHFYINCDFSDDKPPWFYCQKCHTTGVVSSNHLLEWGIYDPEVAINLTKYNKRIMSLSKNRKFKSNYVYNIRNTIINNDKLSEYKLNYINNRLGANLSYRDCLDMKIILNLKDLLKENKLKPTRHNNIIDQLDSNFVGFISFDNAFISMRNLEIGKVYSNIDKRYINYNIFDSFENTKRFYTIPTTLDITNINPIKLNIAEGAFDILGIYYNLFNGKSDNSIFTSVGGSGYLGLIRFFVVTQKLFNLEIHIYADNDIERDKMIYISNLIKPFGFRFYLHRNIYPGEKDFGVPKNRIKETIERIL